MNTKESIILDQEIVCRIDQNRGDLSKSEFIEFCIDSFLESMPPEEQERKGIYSIEESATTRQLANSYATKEDFQAFKRGIQELTRGFLEFYITFGLELGPLGCTREPDILQDQLDRILANS